MFTSVLCGFSTVGSGFVFFGYLIIFFLSIFLYYQRRKQNLEKFAKSNNTTLEKEPRDFHLQFNDYDFELFKSDETKISTNIIKLKKDEFELTYFEFSFETDKGKNSKTTEQSVVLIKTDYYLPKMFLTPKKIFKKHKKGFASITLLNHNIFLNNYILECKEENSVRNIFLSNMIEYFENNKGFTVETDKNLILVYKYDKTVLSGKPNIFINTGFNIAKLFKENVVS